MQSKAGRARGRRFGKDTQKTIELTVLALPALLLIAFHYVAMPGIIMAFKNFNFRDGIFGSPWLGLENFRFVFITNVYLAPVLDMFNREIISYSISASPNLYQIRDMLQGLFEKLPADARPVFHSDQGWQYQHA